jgi:hypothetical protein
LPNHSVTDTSSPFSRPQLRSFAGGGFPDNPSVRVLCRQVIGIYWVFHLFLPSIAYFVFLTFSFLGFPFSPSFFSCHFSAVIFQLFFFSFSFSAFLF